ncbi:uncharacterized protein EV420DRAFT_1648377 [Desarmillaria tabescens]|uniref:Uncharacterized protein n=1 Tax=Armillaria tabescens TaxID=1929756 RepID=A0AA39JPX4_ARMTA|nr:uncharacterized protein EV420DRAFT_1648377 [Desarmillaria tabescens]KAK0445661.1 hypothetical protein EV420DRAFT_1648377 [Desarmillaria tabescens]
MGVWKGWDMDREYCQPTSSKVLVEDLVTDKDDEKHFRDYHIHPESAENQDNEPARKGRRFWDWPTMQTHRDWPGDHRMPDEWNMMIKDMWGLKGDQARGIPTETIGPIEFTRTRYPNESERCSIQDGLSIAPDWGTAESTRIAAMIEKNEDRNHRKPKKPDKDRKGKHRQTVFLEDDIPALKQAWYEEYEELLQGVPETMLPF